MPGEAGKRHHEAPVGGQVVGQHVVVDVVVTTTSTVGYRPSGSGGPIRFAISAARAAIVTSVWSSRSRGEQVGVPPVQLPQQFPFLGQVGEVRLPGHRLDHLAHGGRGRFGRRPAPQFGHDLLGRPLVRLDRERGVLRREVVEERARRDVGGRTDLLHRFAAYAKFAEPAINVPVAVR
ncbi:MAG TPA: hypothetical protein VHF06_03525, partial [Pseudonocardiaceae bacterium]|nr:hypothetical protein [Pseudonocardiaceae bacterium]